MSTPEQNERRASTRKGNNIHFVTSASDPKPTVNIGGRPKRQRTHKNSGAGTIAPELVIDKWSLPTYQRLSSKEKARRSLEENVRDATKKLKHAKRCLDRNTSVSRAEERSRKDKERLVGIEPNPGPEELFFKFTAPITFKGLRPVDECISWDSFWAHPPMVEENLKYGFYQLDGLTSHIQCPGYYLVAYKTFMDNNNKPKVVMAMRRDDLFMLLIMSGIEPNPGPDVCPYLGQQIQGDLVKIKGKVRVVCPACHLPLTTLAHSKRGNFGLHPGVPIVVAESPKGKEPEIPDCHEAASSSEGVRAPRCLVIQRPSSARLSRPNPSRSSSPSAKSEGASPARPARAPSVALPEAVPTLESKKEPVRPNHPLLGFSLTEKLALRVAKVAATRSIIPGTLLNCGLFKIPFPSSILKTKVITLETDNMLIDYKGEQRPIQNRSVEPIRSAHDCRSVEAQVELTLSPKLISAGAVALGALTSCCNTFGTAMFAAGAGCLALYLAKRLLTMRGQVTVRYAPAMVTSALMDLGKPGPTFQDNIEPTLRRLGSMPLVDVDALQVHKGTALVCEVVGSTPSAFFLSRPPCEAALPSTLSTQIGECLQWVYGQMSSLCPYLRLN